MEQWFVASKRADFYKLGEELGVNPVVARLMRNRDLIELEEMHKYLHGSLEDLYSPYLLKDVEKGADILREKIEAGKKIRIISDYDVDGVASNYILYKGLTACGAEVDYRIPDRIEDGYGINEHLIDQAYQDGIDTIITCDNGIAARNQIAYGKALGMTIVVTDHHDVPFVVEETMVPKKRELLPPADAVINPKQEACGYPFASICGAVVAFKFIQVLLDKMSGHPPKMSQALLDKMSGHQTEVALATSTGNPKEQSLLMDNLLQAATLATVCDVMPLRDENRIIVKEGLKRMNQTRMLGLKALITANNLEDKKITAYHLGFIIGPCINASGRLTSAKEALELLLCEDPNECQKMATYLTALNAERKTLTEEGEHAAYRYLEETGRENDKVLVVYLPDTHESIAGIIAGRIRETYNKPVFVLTKTKEGVKGSGRSIEAYHMFEELTKVSDLFDKFGGHPMAAGLSMAEDRIEEFRTRLNQNTRLTEADFVEKVHIDLAMPVGYITEELVEQLDILEPFGTGNTKPLFAEKNLHIKSARPLGQTGRVLRMVLTDSQGYRMNAIYFGDVAHFLGEMEQVYGNEEVDRVLRGLMHGVSMHCTYYPEINEWNRQRSLQIVVKNYRFLR